MRKFETEEWQFLEFGDLNLFRIWELGFRVFVNLRVSSKLNSGQKLENLCYDSI